MSVGMNGFVLLVQQPGADGGRLKAEGGKRKAGKILIAALRSQLSALLPTHRIDTQCRHPRRKIGINRPAAVFADGRFDEFETPLSHHVIEQSATQQAHANKAR